MAAIAMFCRKLLMNLTSIQLRSIGHLQPDPRWQMSAHAHPYHEVLVVLNGQLNVELQAQTLAGTAGDVLWYPAGVAHREWTENTAPVEALFISVEWPKLRAPARLLVHDTGGRIGQLARWLYAEREQDAAFREGAARVFTQALVAEFLRLAAQRVNPWVAQLRKFMHQRMREPLRLADLAAHGQVSPFHFIRRYRALTGRTPMEDLRRVRLEAARDLLLTTDLPLKEIAPRCGLGDEYHLSRLFRKVFATSPGRLRR